MGEETKISWTDSTWNPWIGCHKLSPGCARCYAERLVRDRMGREFTEIRRSAPATFNAPLKWKEPKRVFTCSISDFFIEEADTWRDEVWEIIRRTPHITYQILTKRPGRITGHLPNTCFRCGGRYVGPLDESAMWCGCSRGYGAPWPWPNVWLGTSVENQKYAEERIPKLVTVPAAVHFLSCEPLLGPINFQLPENGDEYARTNLLEDVEWVICGGESGPNYRPMDLDWARSIRDQSISASVPYFYKQGNGLRSEMDTFLDGREWREMPISLTHGKVILDGAQF